MLKPLPDVKYLNSILSYNPHTGRFMWIERTPDMFQDSKRDPEWACRWWNSRFAGIEAGTIHPYGYRLIRVKGIDYFAHRLAWYMWHDGIAPEFIDHINGVRDDNRIQNLRSVNHEDNTKNAKRRADNRSGTTGVSFYPTKGTWRARINYMGNTILLGYFHSKDEAIAARRAAEKVYQYHTNHGR